MVYVKASLRRGFSDPQRLRCGLAKRSGLRLPPAPHHANRSRALRVEHVAAHPFDVAFDVQRLAERYRLPKTRIHAGRNAAIARRAGSMRHRFVQQRKRDAAVRDVPPALKFRSQNRACAHTSFAGALKTQTQTNLVFRSTREAPPIVDRNAQEPIFRLKRHCGLASAPPTSWGPQTSWCLDMSAA